MSILTALPTLWVPAAATPTIITPVNVAWNNGNWFQLIASTSNPIAVVGIMIFPGISASIEGEIDIGKGAAASETVVATFPFMTESDVSAGWTQYLTVPVDNIAGSTRVAARIRKSGTSTTNWRVALGYIENYDASNKTAQIPSALPSAAAGASITPSGSNWGNSAYAQITASTASAIGITALIINAAVAGEYEIDIATGAAASEVVKYTIPETTTLAGCQRIYLPHPLRIPTGTRVAVRLRKPGTDTTAWTAKIEYIVDDNVDALGRSFATII